MYTDFTSFVNQLLCRPCFLTLFYTPLQKPSYRTDWILLLFEVWTVWYFFCGHSSQGFPRINPGKEFCMAKNIHLITCLVRKNHWWGGPRKWIILLSSSHAWFSGIGLLHLLPIGRMKHQATSNLHA